MSVSYDSERLDLRPIVCVACRQTNPARHRFCAHCGERLWEPCLSCGAKNACDVVYCGQCGENVQRAFERHQALIQSELEKVERLRTDGMYAAAIEILQALRSGGDSRLEPTVELATKRVDALQQERMERQQAAGEVFQAVQKRLTERDYVGAHRELCRIPPGLRNRSMQQAWEQVHATVREIEALTAHIRQSLKSQQDEQLLPHVLRLLELQPDDTRLSRLAKDLKQRHDQRDLCVAEKQLEKCRDLLARHAYDQAARELADVNPELLPPKSRALYDTVHELAWILNQVRTTPFVSPQLAAIVQRWRRLRPNDAQAKRFEEELARRWKRRKRNQHFPVLWGKSPSPPRLGLPILPWQGIERAHATGDASPITDRLMLAYGLALQGLGVARLNVNLLPRERGAWWRRLSGLREAKSTSPVWGIDLGTSALKAVELRRDSPHDKIDVLRAVCLPHQHPLNVAESDDQVVEICRETIERFATHCELTRASAVIGFPGPRSLGRSFEIPRLKASKLDEVIAYEARIQIPVPLDEIVFDWHVWPDEDPDSRMQSVTMLAARKVHIQRLLAPLADSPIQPIAVQSDCLALYNAAAYEFWPDVDAADQKSRSPFAVLEVGTDATNLVLVSPFGIRYRSLPIGTERMNRSLIQRFQLPRNKVEQLRQQPAAAQWMYQIDEVLKPLFLELVQDTQRTLAAYEADNMHAQELFVTGGGAGQHGLLRELIRDTTAGEVKPRESDA